MNNCHRVATQLQLNISYQITLYWNNTISSTKKARCTGKLQQKDLVVKSETLANVDFLLKVQKF